MRALSIVFAISSKVKLNMGWVVMHVFYIIEEQR
jgi:hypothetical protein